MIISLDVGSTYLKCALYSENAELVQEWRVENPLRLLTSPGEYFRELEQRAGGLVAVAVATEPSMQGRLALGLSCHLESQFVVVGDAVCAAGASLDLQASKDRLDRALSKEPAALICSSASWLAWHWSGVARTNETFDNAITGFLPRWASEPRWLKRDAPGAFLGVHQDLDEVDIYLAGTDEQLAYLGAGLSGAQRVLSTSTFWSMSSVQSEITPGRGTPVVMRRTTPVPPLPGADTLVGYRWGDLIMGRLDPLIVRPHDLPQWAFGPTTAALYGRRGSLSRQDFWDAVLRDVALASDYLDDLPGHGQAERVVVHGGGTRNSLELRTRLAALWPDRTVFLGGDATMLGTAQLLAARHQPPGR